MVTGCITPDLGSRVCVSDSATVNSLIEGKWRWVQRTLKGKTSNRCTLNRNEEHYFEFFADGTIYDQIDNNCPLVGEFQINSTGYLDSYVDTFSKYKTLVGQASICNGYLVISDTAWGTTDVYAKE